MNIKINLTGRKDKALKSAKLILKFWSTADSDFWSTAMLFYSRFWPGEFHGLYSPWGRKELGTTE